MILRASCVLCFCFIASFSSWELKFVLLYATENIYLKKRHQRWAQIYKLNLELEFLKGIVYTLMIQLHTGGLLVYIYICMYIPAYHLVVSLYNESVYWVKAIDNGFHPINGTYLQNISLDKCFESSL